MGGGYITTAMNLALALSLLQHVPEMEVTALEGDSKLPRRWRLNLVYLHGRKCAVSAPVLRKFAGNKKQLQDKATCHAFLLFGIPGTTDCAVVYSKTAASTSMLLQYSSDIAPGCFVSLFKAKVIGINSDTDTRVLQLEDPIVPLKSMHVARDFLVSVFFC